MSDNASKVNPFAGQRIKVVADTPAAHPADSAEALLRAALDNLLRHHNAGSVHESAYIGDCEFARQAHAALQAPAPSPAPVCDCDADKYRGVHISACPAAPSPVDPNITLNHPPSPAADRIEEARRDLWARIGGAAAEGSEPLDVLREVAGSGIEWTNAGRYHVVQIDIHTWDEVQRLAAYASQQPAAAERTSDLPQPTRPDPGMKTSNG